MDFRVISLIAFLTFIPESSTLRAQGVIESNDSGWAFLVRFTSGNGPQWFTAFLSSAQRDMEKSQLMLLFYKCYPWRAVQWNEVYYNKVSCEEAVRRSEIFQMSPHEPARHGVPLGNGSVVLRLPDEHKTPWCVAIADCALGRVSVEYDVHFENSDDPESLLPGTGREVACDDEGFLELHLVGFFVAVVLVGFQAVSVATLVGDGIFHPLMQLHAVATASTTVYMLLGFIYWDLYVYDGFRRPWLEYLYYVSSRVHVVPKMLLLVLLGRGWPITTSKLSYAPHLVAATVLCAVVAWIDTTYTFATYDPAVHFDSHKYYLSNVQSCIRLAAWAVFLASLVATRRTEQRTAWRSSYVRLGLLASVWFLTQPLFSLPASTPDVDDTIEWDIARFNNFVMILVDTVTSAYLVYLLWPSRVARAADWRQPAIFTITPHSLWTLLKQRRDARAAFASACVGLAVFLCYLTFLPSG